MSYEFNRVSEKRSKSESGLCYAKHMIIGHILIIFRYRKYIFYFLHLEFSNGIEMLKLMSRLHHLYMYMIEKIISTN